MQLVALALGGKGNVFMPIDGSISQVRVVDVATGRVLVDHREEKDVILGFAFSQDGRRFLATVAEVRPRMTSMQVPSSLKLRSSRLGPGSESGDRTVPGRVHLPPHPARPALCSAPMVSRIAAETRAAYVPSPLQSGTRPPGKSWPVAPIRHRRRFNWSSPATVND